MSQLLSDLPSDDVRIAAGTNWVPPEGPKDAAIALVGEAPGSQERRLNRPFCGPSGQLLDKLLLGAGLTRKSLYVTNVVKEQPNANDITIFLDLSKRIPIEGPKWPRYVDLLRRELESVPSNVIVAVGAVPLWALCHRKGITKLRGSILESTLLPGRKVIPIVHPAAALREHLFTHMIRWDLRRIKAESQFPELRPRESNLILTTNFDQIISFIKYLHQTLLRQPDHLRYTVCDIEVLNEEISCLCVGHEALGVLCVPFVCEEGDCFMPEHEVEIWDCLSSLLSDPSIICLGQNLAFDGTFIFQRYGIPIFPVQDTMVAQGIAYPDFPKGLDFTTSVYTREPYYKDEGKKWFKLGGSFRDLWRYNAKDGDVLPEIFRHQRAELNRQGNLNAYHNQVRLVEPLVYMGTRGILCDRDGLVQASKDAAKEIEELTEQLTSLVGYELNPKAPKQLAEFFYVTRGFKPYTNRKTGNVSVDRDALKRLSRKGSQEAALLLRIRKLGKLKGTYLDITLDPDSRLRCSFNPVGTSSGRLSSSKTIFGTGGNMQNLPNEFKRYLRFDPGYIGYNVDLSQAENRTVAWVAPDELMIRAFNEKMDVHSLTGSLISGLPYDEVKRQDNDGIYCPIGGGLYTWRFWGKKANHGLNYDLGYRSFAFLYEIPERDAQYIVERYHQAYPGVRQYHAWIRSKLSQGRVLENLLGRRRLFLGRWGDELFKEAYSFIPQSTIADKLNQHGLLPLYYDKEFEEVEPLNQVHDSLVFQIPMSVPWHRHTEILFALKASLESPLECDGRRFSIPMDIEFSVAGNLGKHSESNPNGLHKFTGTTPEDLVAQVRSIIDSTKLGEANG